MVTLSNINNSDGIMIGGKYTNDKSLGDGGLRGGGVDMVLDGGAETGIGIKSTALRKNN